MKPDEVRVCVTSGYHIGPKASAGLEQEAIVYEWGGQTLRRFTSGATSHITAEQKARLWAAGNDAMRAELDRIETFKDGSWRIKAWKRFLDAA